MNKRRPKNLFREILFCLIFLTPQLFFAQIAIDTIEIEVQTTEYVAGEPAVFIGETIELSVGLYIGDFAYQWNRDGVAMPGETSATLTLNNVSWDEALARYTCSIIDFATSGLIATHDAKIESYKRDASGGIYSARQFMARKGNVSQAEWDKLKEDLNVVVVDECLCELELWEISGSCVFEHDSSIVNLISIEQTVGHAKSRIESADFVYSLTTESFDVDEIVPIGTQVRQEAMESMQNATTVRVAVVDGGVDNNHPALSAYQYNNPLEIPFDKIDNDNNCLVDDYNGYDFIADTGAPTDDFLGHGTHVAGIIASMVPQNAPLELIDVKIFDDNGYGNAFDAVCGMYYAIVAKADIINASWGYSGEPIGLLEKVIKVARNRGILVVTSAGNEGHDVDLIPHYPSSTPYSNVISVTSIDNCDRLRGNYSSSGLGVDLAAYGYDIYSTLPDNKYGRSSGTSMATPAVTGFLAATLLEQQFSSYHELKYYLKNKIIKMPSLFGKVSARGKLDFSQGQYIDLDISLKLGGALDLSNPSIMRTDLGSQELIYGLFPGLPNNTFMQPYFEAPWDYNGTEGQWSYIKFDNGCSDVIPTDPAIPIPIPTNPPLDEEVIPINLPLDEEVIPIAPTIPTPKIVDWVLVSFRSDVTAASEFRKVAAHLLDDGKLHFLEPRVYMIQYPQDCFIVIEHRNHLPIMTPHLITVQNGQLTYDFTGENSYSTTGAGQNEHILGEFSMIPGDVNGDTDISGLDYDLLLDNFGLLGVYESADLNMDGNVDFTDEVILKLNDGQHSSVPK